MLDVLNRITAGGGKPEDIDLLEEMSSVIIDSSLCQLGGSAPNPVLSTLKYFREEYRAHIEDKRCPAGVCSDLVSHVITEACDGCHLCVTSCPTGAITGNPKELHSILQMECIQCGACYQVCRNGAVDRVKRGEGDPIQAHAKDAWTPREKVKANAATAV